MIKPVSEPQDIVFTGEYLERMPLTMQSLTKEYLYLFNTIVQVQQELRQLEERLILAQQTAEELYLERTDEPAA